MNAIITVDVEGDQGTDTYEAVAAFDEFQAMLEVPLTMFVTPDVVANDPERVLRWHSNGHMVGLHIHPDRLTGGSDFMTDYGKEAIVEMLKEACAVFEEFLEFTPKYFRAGRWEFSKALIRALSELGFHADASLVPSMARSQSDIEGITEYPLTIYRNVVTPLLLSFWETKSIPLYADWFLPKIWSIPGFYAVTWQLLRSQREYVMTAFHDYDVISSTMQRRMHRYIRFLTKRSEVLTLQQFERPPDTP